jgi:hypothetical protein
VRANIAALFYMTEVPALRRVGTTQEFANLKQNRRARRETTRLAALSEDHPCADLFPIRLFLPSRKNFMKKNVRRFCPFLLREDKLIGVTTRRRVVV